MKKKLLLIVLLFAMILTVCSCGNSNENHKNKTNTSTNTASKDHNDDSSVSTVVSDDTVISQTGDENNEDPDYEPNPKDQIEYPTSIPVFGDWDGNGVEDYIVVEHNEDGGFEDKYLIRWSVFFNNECVFTKYHGLMSNFEVSYLDLTGDGSKEIFVLLEPYVNSMPLEEFVVLKDTAEGWQELENSTKYHPEAGENATNAFPIHVYYGSDKNLFRIECEEIGSLEYDVTDYYTNKLSEYDESSSMYQLAYDILYTDKYSEGDVMGQTQAWGIWDLTFDTYNGRDCIVATHGLEGLEGKFDGFGSIDVYFFYNDKGEIVPIGMKFTPYLESDLY